ncbi:MAG: hypothetical protein WAN35_02970 [Terracidiphilus sp.]
MLKIWITVVGFSGILSIAVAAQVTETQSIIPNTASVSAEEHLQLVPGVPHIFLLTFDHPPSCAHPPCIDIEGRARIHYSFRKVKGDTSLWYIYPDNPYDILNDQPVELHNNQTKYELPLTINETTSPGIWKLNNVTIEWKRKSWAPPESIPILIRDNVTFEIPHGPQITARIQSPTSVRAGQTLKFKIYIDGYPDGLRQGCLFNLSGYLSPVNPKGQTNQSHDVPPPIGWKSIVIRPDQRSYEMSADFNSDIPGGPWEGVVLIRGDIDETGVNSFSQAEFKMAECHSSVPKLRTEDTQFSFNVIAADESADPVMPTSATVMVNPSQIELLHYEADRLRAKAEQIKSQLRSDNLAANQSLLLKNVKEAMTDLDKTETSYKEKGDKRITPADSQAINIFFDDIRFSYHEALKSLKSNSAQLYQTEPRLALVNFTMIDSSLHLDPSSIRAINSLFHAAKAYDILASSKYLTFDLEVTSTPDHAKVSYKQRLDQEFKTLDHETDTSIKNLYHATYLIRFQKTGCEEIVKTFEGGETNSTNEHADLICKEHAQ